MRDQGLESGSQCKGGWVCERPGISEQGWVGMSETSWGVRARVGRRAYEGPGVSCQW